MFRELTQRVSDLLPATALSNAVEVERTERPSAERWGDSILPKEEQVTRLLSEHDGRMWQSTVADETGFSESKTSRLLCAMEEDGKIIRHRVGRRKVVNLLRQKQTN